MSQTLPTPARATPTAPVRPTRPIATGARRSTVLLPIAAALVAGVLLPTEPRAALLVVLFVGLLASGLGSFESVLHVLVASVFVESVSLGGGLRVGRLLAVVALAAIGLRMIATTWRPARLPARAWLPMGLFAAWAWASAFWARDQGPWSFAVGQLGLAMCFFAAFATFTDSAESVRRLLRTFVSGALLAAVIGLAQMATGARAQGLQGDPNIYALYQAAAIAAAAGLARVATGRSRQWWYLATVPLLASIVASQSRGGLITVAVVFASMVASRDRLRALRPGQVAAGVAVAAVAVTAVLSVPAVKHRISPEKVEQDRGSGRIDIWYVAWRSIGRHPWTGLGAGNFKSHSIELLESEPGVQLVKSHLLLSPGIETHNVYLETLAEYGVVGFGLFVAVLITAGTALRRAARAPGADPVLRALPGMLLAFAVGAFFLSIVNNKLLWTLVGLAGALHARRRDPSATAPMLEPR